jgi:flavin reductase (DIM6/NTAB) family NADH-FMN oxidoreductase RutF
MADPIIPIPNAEEFRKVLGHFATGVTVVTVDDGALVHGMTANAFTSVSLDPLLILVCIGKKARTHRLVAEQMRFGVNVLAENHEEWARYFALVEQNGITAERLGIRFTRSALGTPMLEGGLARLDCKKVSFHNAGDHSICVGEVEDVQMADGQPLIFFRGRFRRLPRE